MSNLNTILALLPKLTREQLATVRAAADHLLAPKEGDVSPVFDVLTSMLGYRMTYFQFLNGESGRNWGKNCASLDTFINTYLPCNNRIVRTAVTAFLLDLLRADLKQRCVPVTMRSMVVNFNRVPELFDSQFPGYRNAGLAHLVVDKITKNAP